MNARLIRLFIPTIVTMQLTTGLLIAMPSATDTPLPQEGMPIQAAPVTQQQPAARSWPPPAVESQQSMPAAEPLAPQGAQQQQTNPLIPQASVPVMPVAAAAQAVQPPQAVPLAQPQQVTQIATTPQINPALFKELDTALQGIEQAKRELSKLLQELDEKLLAARKQAAEAKTLTYNLLNKEQEQEAKADFEKIRNTNKEIQTTQQFVQNEFSKNFNEKIAELRVKATQAEAALKAIKAQKRAEAAKPAAPPAMPLPNTQPAVTEAPTGRTNTPVVGQSGAFDSMTSGIASMVSGIKKIFGDNDAAKKKTVTAQQAPEAIPADATQRSREASTMVQQMDQGLQTIDGARSTIQQYIQTINQSTQYIEVLAKENPDTAKLLAQNKKVPVVVVESKLKQAILLVVGKGLDGMGYLASGFYSLFDNTIGRFTRSLVKDVSAKIAAHDAPKSTPGAA